MKKLCSYIIVTSIILLLSNLIYSQTKPAHNLCATDDTWHSQVQDNPSLGFGMDLFDRQVARSIQSRQNITRQILTIPVVVHIIHNNGPENITDNQVFQGIRDLNDAFRNRAPYDPTQGVDVEIEFCLARQDPQGNLTTGINRVVSPLTNIITPLNDIRLKNLSRWNPLDYLNIWVVNEITSSTVGSAVVGYAVYPSSHGNPEDGVVCEARFFGSNPAFSTVQIHELGHYLGLYHTFEGACTNNNCLLDGDRVCDTPPDASTTDVACNSGINSCTTDSDDFSNNNPFRASPFGLGDVADPVNNYMDYGDPACQVAFTAGQKVRMQTALTGIRSSLLSSPGCNSPCNNPITAAFTPSVNSPVVGSVVNFINASTNATTYTWKVDGTVFSTATNPSFTFLQRGVYTVTLISGSADPNCIDSTSITIQTVCSFNASFTTSAVQIQPGATVNFTNTTTPGATSQQWFLDGVLQSSGFNWSNTFNQFGGFQIMLVSSDGVCKDSAFGFVTVGQCEENNRARNWYFGNFAGLSFANGAPVALTNGGMAALEGTATMSDRYGNLLMYTDGETLFNRNHQIMPNGSGLIGNSSTTQSSIIVPFPGNDSLYYVFTVDDAARVDGLTYSLVDMTLDNGLGDVTSQKNVPLVSPVTERLTAVRHSNGSDYWAIVRGWRNANFYAYHVTCNGLNPNPVVSTVAPVIDSGATTVQFFNSTGQMKVSPDGTKIALGHLETMSIYVYNFDAATGNITSRVNFQGPGTFNPVPQGPFAATYGLEFSPNGRFLYVNNSIGFSEVSQIDLQAGTGSAADILASRVTIGNSTGPMQLGPDGVIYIGRRMSTFLSAIRVPNAPAPACLYSIIALRLGGRSNSLSGSLPGFVTSFFTPQPNRIVGDRVICSPDTATFRTPILNCEDSLVWEFLGEGQIISQKDNAIQIAFSAASSPTDTLIASRFGTCGAIIDTAIITIVPGSTFSIDLGPDTSLCGNASLNLGTNVIAQRYEWSTGQTITPISVTNPGTYTLEATNTNGCIARDTVTVFENLTTTPIDLGPDTCICEGNVVVLDAGVKGVSYLWQDGSIDKTFTAEVPGTYYVTAMDSCGNTGSDTIQVTVCPNQTTISLGNDALLANIDTLDAGNGGIAVPSGICSYLWSTGDTTQKIPVNASGTYSVLINCGGCQAVDDINIFDVILSPELLFFEGKDISDKVRQIRWAPTEPASWEQYKLDHGTSVNTFREIDATQGGESTYSVYVPKPQRQQTDYYRLRMYDGQGVETFSSILSIQSAAQDSWNIFPNPSKGMLYIQGGSVAKTVQVRIINFTGKVLYESTIKSEGEPLPLQPNNLGAGVYLVEIMDAEGLRFVKKWVKVGE